MVHLIIQLRKKKVEFCEGADKEFFELPFKVSKKFKTVIFLLERDGYLKEPEGKKLGDTGLFEIRVRVQGQWRGLYAYYYENAIIILRIFQKKTQKTPDKEIKIALKRLSNL
jgi:phage-related protein